MIKQILPAAVAAIALAVPTLAEAQTTAAQPVALTAPALSGAYATPVEPGSVPEATPGAVNVNATISGQPQPGPNDFQGGQAYGGETYAVPGAPMPGPYMQPGVTPRTTWIPGGYSWNPNTNNYVWAPGQFVEAPRDDAQWVPGHWAQTPTAWIWVGGRWN